MIFLKKPVDQTSADVFKILYFFFYRDEQKKKCNKHI